MAYELLEKAKKLGLERLIGKRSSPTFPLARAPRSPHNVSMGDDHPFELKTEPDGDRYRWVIYGYQQQREVAPAPACNLCFVIHT